jgi:hypothetical protein
LSGLIANTFVDRGSRQPDVDDRALERHGVEDDELSKAGSELEFVGGWFLVPILWQ